MIKIFFKCLKKIKVRTYMHETKHPQKTDKKRMMQRSQAI